MTECETKHEFKISKTIVYDEREQHSVVISALDHAAAYDQRILGGIVLILIFRKFTTTIRFLHKVWIIEPQ